MSPTSPIPNDFRLDSAATAPSSPRGRLVVPAEVPSLTAPPSPNPFDLFQHFTSAPASQRRAAAIYATGGGSSVPFDWEERPRTPKRGLGAGKNRQAAAWDDGDTDFEFVTVVGDKAEALATADELFEKGRIRPLKPRQLTTAGDERKVRPLKPPPGLLDGGSVVSSPMARGGGMRRSRVSSGGVDSDPFAAVLLEATKAPSPLGGKEANGVAAAAPGSPAKKLATRPAARSAGWRRSLLLFRSSSDGGRHVNNKREPIFETAEQFDAPVKKAVAGQPAMMIKANDMGKAKKHGNRSAAVARGTGCVRLSLLQQLAKGLGAYPWRIGRDTAAPATKG